MSLTPSNVEGSTERPASCDNQSVTELWLQFAFAGRVSSFLEVDIAAVNESGRFFHISNKTLLC